MGIFDSGRIQGSLKNPNELKEAFIVEHFKHKPKAEIEKFIKSEEAKYMVEASMIDQDMLERLAAEINYNDRDVQLTVCHMAKENDDPRVQELFAIRAKERKLLDELIEDYGALASGKVGIYKEEFINKGLPKIFR